ncbi:MAG TPA: peptidylprolyl isomerase [bacterium]|nr:peptidylprolyl isomerase [bacterium]
MTLTRDSIDPAGKAVLLHTTAGDIAVYLYPDLAPNHVRNFLYLVQRGFYDGVGFHRIVENFVVQAGQPRPDWTEPVPALQAEFSDTPHTTGTLAAARTSDPNSATSQFYLVLSRTHAKHLDNQYTVFGQAFEGLDVLQRIADNWADKVRTLDDRRADRVESDDRIVSAEVVDRGPYEESIAAFREQTGVR